MILKNPTDSVVSIVIKGIELSIPANGTLEVSDAQGARWMLVHEFLRVESEPVKLEVASKPSTVVPAKSVAPVTASVVPVTDPVKDNK